MPSNPQHTRRTAALAAALAAAAAAPATGQAPTGSAGTPREMKIFETRYYFIHTDLAPAGAREAAVRMTAMAEEYHRRTRGFGGAIRHKLPFHLFRKAEDYYAAGGLRGSAGLYTGSKLLAIAGERTSPRTWRVVQHEGFHQFVHHVIRGQIPVWVNEGLAEYFGEAVFTGDGFVVGVVPPGRLRRLKSRIEGGKLKSVREMMRMSYRQWREQLAGGNYDQAWSMVHFLVHADDGRYVRALNAFLAAVSGGMRYENAWVKHFGRDIEGFEKRWREHWLGAPAEPTRELYQKAVVATLTSFFARCVARRQRYATAEAFLDAAEDGKVTCDLSDYLPPALLAANLPRARRLGTWTIDTPPAGLPRLVCRTGDGRRLVGRFRLRGGKVDRVTVEVKGPADEAAEPVAAPPASHPAPATAPLRAPAADPVGRAIALARAYAASGRKDKARQVLAAALKDHPGSPRVPEARKMLRHMGPPTGD